MDDISSWWPILVAVLVVVLLWRYLVIFAVLIASIAAIAYLLLYQEGEIVWRLGGAAGVLLLARFLISIVDNEAGAKPGRRAGAHGDLSAASRRPCSNCSGGKVPCNHGYEMGRDGICYGCHGSGWKTCPVCKGTGYLG